MNHNPYIIECGDSRYDVRKMNGAALETLEMELQQAITAIKDQIARAAVERRTTGVYASADWFRRAQTARGIKARQLEIVKRARKERVTAERIAARGTFPQHFLDAARIVLPKETYDLVYYQAEAMQAAVAGQASD